MKSHFDMIRHLRLSSHEMFNQVQQAGHTGSWVYVCGNGECWWSEEVYHIYGISRRAEPGNLFLGLVYPPDREKMQKAYSRALDGHPYHVVHRICTPGGEMKWLEQNGRLHAGKSCPVPYMTGMVRDVTAFKKEQERLEAKRADFNAITSYLAETTDTTNLRAIVNSVDRTLRRRIDVVMVGMFVRSGNQISKVVPDDAQAGQALQFQDIHDHIGYLAAKEEEQRFCPAEEYPNPLGREAIKTLGGRSVLAMPIFHGQAGIGALSLILRTPVLLNREEMEFCRTICGYLSNQLNSALLYEQLKKELALRTRLESDRDIIFHESVDYITIIDKDGCFQQINPAFAARLGYEPQALLGLSVFDFIHPDDRAFARCTFHDLPRLGVLHGFCNRFICRDGEVGYLENNLKYRKDTGCTIAIARDVTSQREMESRNQALEQSITMEKMKSEFYANLSHEFKTPLNIVLSSLDLLRMKCRRENPDNFAPEYARFFDYAYQNCYKLHRLTANLLDSSRIDSRHYQLAPTRFELGGLLRDITESTALYAGGRGLTLRYAPALKGEAWVSGDVDSLDRVLLNLLSNAIKNTPAGGGIQVGLEEDGAFYRIYVKDTGVGIAPDFLPYLFDKFRTRQNSLAAKRDGSGLGLYIVKSLVELHGGTVGAKSLPEHGSIFTFTLPRLSDSPAVSAVSDEIERRLLKEARHSRVVRELSDIP